MDSGETAAYIRRWQPSSVSPQAAGFARDVVAAAGPGGQERAKNLLWAAGRLADWAHRRWGWSRCPAGAAAPVGDRAVCRARARADRRDAADAAHQPAVPGPGGRSRAGAGGHAAAPRARQGTLCSPAEIDGYLALAAAQPTAARRMRAAGLVCLGAGAGLIRADLRAVRGTDISCRSGGVIVAVGGNRPRAVPVLARYHEPLLAAAAFAGTGLVTGGHDPARRNVTTPLTRALAGGTGLPRLDTSRLRATWLADCAPQIGLATFMHAAGITCSQRLGDLLASLEPGSEAEAVALLGAAPR